MGMRQLIYHHNPSRFLPSRPSRAHPRPAAGPYQLSEARIADYLVEPLEGIDKTSTFFEDVYRLPPGSHHDRHAGRHAAVAVLGPSRGPSFVFVRRRVRGGIFEVFTEAVRCRLRTVGL